MEHTDESKTQFYRLEEKQLRQEFSSLRATIVEISEYMQPRLGRYLKNTDEKANDGSRKDKKIINGSAYDAIRITAAGMQGGLTSPSRPWYRLAFADEEIMEYAPVRNWLHQVRLLMMNVFSRSNFYGSVHSVYKELALFSTSAMLMEEDFQTVLRCRQLTAGEYVLGLDESQRVALLYRQFSMAARQMVEKFGKDNVSNAVKTAVQNNAGETRFEIYHGIRPRRRGKAGKATAQGMSYESVYFEKATDSDKFLRQGGYKGLPFVAPRWEVAGSDTWGNDCPGMIAIGDVRMLQKMEQKKLKALDKLVDPPMNAPTSMKKRGGTVLPGGVNYVDVQQGQQSFTPAYLINPDFQKIAFEIERVERRIRTAFFNDLFLAVLSADKRMTATEVAERHEEKMLMLGPVIERVQAELLDPVIARTYEIMFRLNLLPPPPREIAGMDMKIEYLGLLAQAQKMVGTTAVEQLANFVGALVPVSPDVVDKFDADEAVDQYGDMLGVPPMIVRSDDKVAGRRAERSKAQAQQSAMAMAGPAADAAKKLSDAKLGENSALDMLTQGV